MVKWAGSTYRWTLMWPSQMRLPASFKSSSCMSVTFLWFYRIRQCWKLFSRQSIGSSDHLGTGRFLVWRSIHSIFWLSAVDRRAVRYPWSSPSSRAKDTSRLDFRLFHTLREKPTEMTTSMYLNCVLRKAGMWVCGGLVVRKYENFPMRHMS